PHDRRLQRPQAHPGLRDREHGRAPPRRVRAHPPVPRARQEHRAFDGPEVGVPTVRVSATARYLRGSTRKARLITSVIKGKPVEEAAALLRFMPQDAARDIAHVLRSATANAENNHNLSAGDLVVADAIAN